MEGLCGKNCDTCDWREKLACPGCQEGPGKAFSGDCQVAACCREKGHECCATCYFLGNGCMKYKRRDDVPAMRLRDAERKQERRKWMNENAPVLGKWLWVLFWLVIPDVVANIMTNENVVALAPGLRVSGELLSLLCGLVYAFILWQLREVEGRYHAAALGFLVSAIAGGAATAVTWGEGSLGLGFLALALLVLAMAGNLYGTYQEYNAHAAVLEGLDDGLAENWRRLWKWEIGFLLGLFGCILLMMISAVLGLLALIAVLIGIVAVGILKLVYLWRMAKLFQEYIPCE